MSKPKLEELKLFRNYAWDYFALHANQRTTLFRYFIVFVSLYMTGIALMIRGFACSGISSEIFVIVASIAFIVVTYIFWRLDKRNIQLIGFAKSSLIEVENKLNDKDPKNDLVFQMQAKTPAEMKHSKCYEKIFVAAPLLGLIFIIWAAISLYLGKDDCSMKHITIHSVPTEQPSPVCGKQN